MKISRFRSAAILLAWGAGTAAWAQTPPAAAPIRLKLPVLNPIVPTLTTAPDTIVGLAVDAQGQVLEGVQITVHRVPTVAMTGDPPAARSPLTETADNNRAALATVHGGSYGTYSELEGNQNGIKTSDPQNNWSGSISFTPSHDQHLVTDIGGHYEARVQSGQYHLEAVHKILFDGVSFVLPLCPTEQPGDVTVDDNNGVAKNFVWRLAGLKPGADPDRPASYYGAPLWLKAASGGKRSSPIQAEIVLLPTGPLADGSAAAPLTLRCTLSDKAVCWKNIPLGRYTAQATVIRPNGQRQPLLLRADPSGKAAQEALPLHFRPIQDGTPEASLSVVAY